MKTPEKQYQVWTYTPYEGYSLQEFDDLAEAVSSSSDPDSYITKRVEYEVRAKEK